MMPAASGDLHSRARAMAARLRSRFGTLAATPLVRQMAGGLAWNVGAVAVERLIGLLQAFFVARLLGIEQFGKFGLVFVTIGLLSSLVGLQLGLTAAVHIAGARQNAPDQAAAVMRLCDIVAIGLCSLSFLLIAMSPDAAARYLFGGSAHADVVVSGAAIASLSVISGLQEGVLQGLEQFRNLAILRAGFAAASFVLLMMLGRTGDLATVVFALMLGAILRTTSLLLLKEAISRRRGYTATASAIWRTRHVILAFSLPAVLASLVGGLSNWYGFYLVSRLNHGFSEVAVISAGQQWRGLALYLTTISAGVAIPMMSRLAGTGDVRGLRQVHIASLWVNVGAAIAFVCGLGLWAGPVLSFYGHSFVDSRLIFWLVVATTVPMVFANVYLQYLVSQGRMWEQLAFYLCQAIPLIAGYFAVIPTFGALGFALWTGAVGLGLCCALAWRIRVKVPVGLKHVALNA